MRQLAAALRYALRLRKSSPYAALAMEDYLRELPRTQQSQFSQMVAEILKVLKETDGGTS